MERAIAPREQVKIRERPFQFLLDLPSRQLEIAQAIGNIFCFFISETPDYN
jgi:hypothetical protein